MSMSGRFLRRLRSQRDVPDVLTVRTEATPNRLCFIDEHGPSPLALRARDGNRRLWNRHGMQSSESMRRRAVQN